MKLRRLIVIATLIASISHGFELKDSDKPADVQVLEELINTSYSSTALANHIELDIKVGWDSFAAWKIGKLDEKRPVPGMFIDFADVAKFDSSKHATVRVDGTNFLYDGVSLDVMTLIACHEIGHILGGRAGFGKVGRDDEKESIEGQADYFSTLKCTKRLWKGHTGFVRKPESVSALMWDQCTAVYSVTDDQAVCQRTLKAISELINSRLLPSSEELKIDGQSSFKPGFTLISHPDPQCRIQTMVAGAFCNKSLPLSRLDPREGACSTENGDNVGLRPRCWYVPGNEEQIIEMNKFSKKSKSRALILEP